VRVLSSMTLALLFSAVSAAQDQGCPEGYIEGPSSTKEQVQCTFVGYGEEEDAYADEIPEGMDEFLVIVRDQVYKFADRLPNYVCDQSTDRFKAGSNPPNWKRQDRINNEILFVDGRESYRDYLRNGKKLKERSPVSTGLWSTGDFATVVLDLFDPTSAAQFKYVGMDKVGNVETRLYDFVVEQENSHWKLNFGGERFQPGYTGAIWVEPETRTIRRIEFGATELPITYPKDVAELAAEFGPIEIAGSEHLLAVNSTVMSCHRWKKTCEKNESVYTNYRMFGAESTVMQTDSSVTFDGEETVPKQ
jgi:hypothetical protein